MNAVRLLLSSFLMIGLLSACSTEESSDTSAPVADAADVVAVEVAENPHTGIAAGMTQSEITTKLGKATVTESYKLDNLEVIHMEWHNADGIVSVQLHNGKAAYSQFTPAQ